MCAEEPPTVSPKPFRLAYAFTKVPSIHACMYVCMCLFLFVFFLPVYMCIHFCAFDYGIRTVYCVYVDTHLMYCMYHLCVCT